MVNLDPDRAASKIMALHLCHAFGIVLAFLIPSTNAAAITSVEPHSGSLNGATYVTIHGSGFSEDQFNFGTGNENLGNSVKLVSTTQTYDCPVHRDETHEYKVVCYTAAMPHDTYHVRVSVDGVQVPEDNICSGNPTHSNCAFTPQLIYTPRIYEISPQSGPPGTILTVTGYIYTSLFETNQEESTNGRDVRIVRVYVGGQLCELRINGTDELYGIELNDDGSSDYGFFKCKMSGTYVGNQNASFILDGSFGRSLSQDHVLRVTAQNKIVSFQSYAAITSVTPSTGSVEGGTLLTISGQYFDETNAPSEVTVGGLSCPVLNISDSEIICETSPMPSQINDTFPGNRGAHYAMWNDTYSTSPEAVLAYNHTPALAGVKDDFFWYETLNDYYNSRLWAYFVPPSDNDYQFFIKADDAGYLYFSLTGDPQEKQLIAYAASYTSGYHTHQTQRSERYTLEGGTPYYMELVHREAAGGGSVNVAVLMFYTTFTYKQAGMVQNEQQKLVTSSTILPEIQTLEFTTWPESSQTPTNEVQQVEVVSSFPDEVIFRLGLYGQYTDLLLGNDPTSSIEDKLNDLTVINTGSFTVTKTTTGTGFVLDILFNSDLGDWPLFDAVMDTSTGANATFSVTESTPGVPAMTSYVLSFGGVPTPPIAFDADANHVEAAIQTLTSARCPSDLTSPVAYRMYQDYDSVTYYQESGSRVTNVEPFCGYTVSKNPAWIFKEGTGTPSVNIMTYNILCFAYHGDMQSRIQLRYYYTMVDSPDQESRYDTFDLSMTRVLEWGYVCMDMRDAILNLRPTYTSLTLRQVKLYRTSSQEDYYVDTVMIGSVQPTTDIDGMMMNRRLRPTLRAVDDIHVDGNTTEGFTVTITTHSCEHELPLLAFEHTMASVSVSTATFSWGSGGATITRIQSASPPISGTINLQFGDQSITGIPVDATAETMQLMLETADGMGSLDVSREGSCAGYTWNVAWLTAPGDQPLFIVDNTTDIQAGANAQLVVSTIQDGGVFIDPIPGDMLRTAHGSPQVAVKINGIPSACIGVCDFEWTQEATPSISNITPSSGSSVDGTSLTITGTGFDSDAANISVVIGGESCDVTIATANEIQCNIGPGPAGSHDVILRVYEKGLAAHHPSTFTFTYDFALDSVTPTTGSVSGGTKLTVQGSGFGANITVTVGDLHCEVTSANYSYVECITPAQAAPGNQNVTVQEGGRSDNGQGLVFDYQLILTPVITSVSNAMGSVSGSVNITIQGSGFGTHFSEDSLSIGDIPLTVFEYSDTEIVAELPPLGAGNYSLVLFVEGRGFADTETNNIPQIEYAFGIHSVFPNGGSIAGGTLLTVTGQGFSDDPAENIIKIGGITCTPEVANSTHIECVTGGVSTTHQVDNSGTHPNFGEGYAWNPATLRILVGDVVTWSWQANELMTSMRYTVRQTASPSASESMEGGFGNNDESTQSGTYQYQFNREGTYYYWSENVDEFYQIFMRGTIKVLPRDTQIEQLSLTVNGYEAQHNRVGVNNGLVSFGSGRTDFIHSNCTSNNTDTVTDRFTFAYSPCHTAKVHGFYPTFAPSTDEISFVGEGFSESAIENEVDISGHPCYVSAANSTFMTCLLAPGNLLQVGVPLPVSVRTANLGNALVTVLEDLDQYFYLLPHITSVNPANGSVAGGTILNITGSGFSGGSGAVSVLINGIICHVLNVSYTEISCITSNAYEMSANIQVSVHSIFGQQLVAECRGSCDYTYSDAETPTVSSVSPTTLAAFNTNITINGTLFGNDRTAVRVTIGQVECNILEVSDTEITCESGYPVAGSQAMVVSISPHGLATPGTSVVYVIPQSYSISPSAGSLNGGTEVTISGYGFDLDSTQVTVDGTTCDITSITASVVECITPSGSGMSATVAITSNSISFPELYFNYSSDLTPIVISISGSPGSPGDDITITGTGFGNDATVTLGTTQCLTTSVTNTEIVCIVGEHSAGEFDVRVDVPGKGLADSTTTFEFLLSVDSITPSSGSFGGGQNVTIAGHGFDRYITNVTICGVECLITQAPTPTEIFCDTPAKTGSGTEACSVIVSVGDEAETTSYNYEISLTPEITSVSPRRGGTGGGTSLTVTGSGFGTDAAAVSVTIAGSECSITAITDTMVTCITGTHSPSIQTQVRLEVQSNGIALQTDADFEYVDMWSSVYTWGGIRLPVEGDFVVIPSHMTILLDVTTPILHMLLIDGGKLIFDEVDLELHAQYILITNGGTLQVGTETHPFQHNAVIELHGHVLSDELPIYGAKVLAVRNGILDLHGKPVNVTWTKLGQTANAGDTSVTLEEPVDWSVGDQIAIATTGSRLSQSETETRYITSVSSDGLTIGFNEALLYKHLGQVVDLGFGYELEARAEVAMLSRNVIIRGHNNVEWNDDIPACPDGFDPGQFATQTCFQGRFGEEIGSDMYGSHIIMHPTRPNEDLVIGRLSYVEITYAGQAYRLRRYAIHYHLHGDAKHSYVRGCAIHKSFNRALVIHGTNYVKVERNVIYDIMGGAFFLEDGVEIGNVFEYNLALFVKSSSSLQNDDITPAAFWATNPNNTFRFNHAAGGTHFGFWYRMHSRPDGPSYDPNYCPQHIPLGTFANNTVHSQGWFGLWIFQAYFPKVGGGCGSNTPEPAKFYSLTAWNNEKGGEWTSGGAIHFVDFFVVNNAASGLEMHGISGTEPFSQERGAMIKDGVIVARPQETGVLHPHTTSTGLVLPLSRGLLVDGVTFVNFDSSTAIAVHVKKPDNGGFGYRFSNLTFLNSPSKAAFHWQHEAVLEDTDGTLTGIVGGKAVATSPILPPGECSTDLGFSAGSVCSSSVNFHRWSWNNPSPSSLLYKNVLLTSQYGVTTVPYQRKRLTHPEGWMCLLVSGETYQMDFINAEHLTDISYSGMVYELQEDEYVILQHNITQHPEMFQIIPSVPASNGTDIPVDGINGYHGDFFFDDDQSVLSYLVSGRSRVSKRDTTFMAGVVDRNIALDVLQVCASCGEPLDIDPDAEMAADRPASAVYWSSPASWEGTDLGWGGNNGDGTYGPPAHNTNVKIVSGVWMVADTEFPIINELYIYGILEFEYHLNPDTGTYYNFTLSAEAIIIAGGRLIIGWEENPFLGQADIILRGNHLSPEVILQGGTNIGAKAMGVFGGLDLHGLPRNVSWTQLNETALAGSSLLVLKEPTDWVVGDEVVIVSTSFSANQSEVLTIAGVGTNGTTITLNDTLRYQHTVATENIGGGRTFTMAAEVGLLARNIRIIGHEHRTLFDQAFGARVIVGSLLTIEGIDLIGYARIDNVQFIHCGQDGYVDWYDPRYALAWLNTGDVTNERPSYVKHSSFYHSFSPAVGVFGANGLDIEDNVVYHTVGQGLVFTGADNKARRNLVTRSLWPSTFNGRFESQSITWQGCIETVGAVRPVLTDNVVAGCERMGFRVDGEPCSTAVNPAESWSNNVAHSSLIGVAVLNGGVSGCTLLSNFTTYKSYDYGMYFQGESSLEVTSYTSLDNNIGLFPMVVGPNVVSHQFANKYVHVSASAFVGTTSAFDCDLDVMDVSDPNIMLSSQSRSWSGPGGGKIGLATTTFTQSPNNAPIKSFSDIKAYNAMYGLTTISGVEFLKFTSYCDVWDTVLTTNPKNDDAIHPVRTSAITFTGVDANKKAYIHRPNLSKINPADCVDMDCDGLKKALVDDLDGTFMGHVGTLLPESEWEWDGDARRGLGDYRLPMTLLTDPDGNRLYPQDICPNKGIIRDDSCVYHTDYQGWVCEDMDYEMLMVESLDSDSETRRLSPIAIMAEGYVDLVNGPQDHGWCGAYTCQKRVSLFPFLVAMNKTYKFHYTGTSPQDTRLHLLNSDDSQAIVLAIYYSTAQRLDVYYQGMYIPPKNAVYNDQGQQGLAAPFFDGEYDPDVVNDPAGTNYYDNHWNLQYVLVRGSSPVDIVTSPLVTITFLMPAVTIDEFYGENLVNNLALFLGISADNIIIADAVSEVRRRRRRATTNSEITIQISNPAGNGTGNATLMTAEDLANVSATIVNAVQLSVLSGILNITILSVDITEPLPEPGSDIWDNLVEALDSGADYQVTLQVPEDLNLEQEATYGYEMSPMLPTPSVRMFDTLGEYVTQLGSWADPWELTATLVMKAGSHPDAYLYGDATIPFWLGWGNFTNLAVSHAGDYTIEVIISSPLDAVGMFSALSFDVTIQPKLLEARVASQPAEVYRNEEITVLIDLMDAITEERLDDISWKNYSWTCNASLYSPSLYATSLEGDTEAVFDTNTSYASLSFSLSEPGRYFIQYRVVSDPADYNLTVTSNALDILDTSLIGLSDESVHEMTLTFDYNYDTYVLGEEAYFLAAVVNKLVQTYSGNVSFTNFTVNSGSILVSCVVTGSDTSVTTTLDALSDALVSSFSIVYDGTTLVAESYLLVDGSYYNGVEVAEASTLGTWELALVIAGCFLVVSAVALLFAIWFNYYKQSHKKHALKNGDQETRTTVLIMDTEDGVDSKVITDNGFDSINLCISDAPSIQVMLNDSDISGDNSNGGYDSSDKGSISSGINKVPEDTVSVTSSKASGRFNNKIQPAQSPHDTDRRSQAGSTRGQLLKPGSGSPSGSRSPSPTPSLNRWVENRSPRASPSLSRYTRSSRSDWTKIVHLTHWR